MKVVVTGGAGYIGSVLSSNLLSGGYDVLVLDKLMYGGRSLLGLLSHPRFRFIKCDISNKSMYENELDEDVCVVHLAAVVGDPACKIRPNEAGASNVEGSRVLIDACVKKRVSKFIFVSTCSNYGKVHPGKMAEEGDKLNPLSFYAETKVIIEEEIKKIDAASLNWTVFRFATAYGNSLRPRFDLTVNDFTLQVSQNKIVSVFLPYSTRPYLHCCDAAKSIELCLNKQDITKNQIYNVGSSDENYKKIEICEEIKKQLNGAEFHFKETGLDSRDYAVNFNKIKNDLGFAISRKVPDGIREIAQLLLNGMLVDVNSNEYYNDRG